MRNEKYAIGGEPRLTQQTIERILWEISIFLYETDDYTELSDEDNTNGYVTEEGLHRTDSEMFYDNLGYKDTIRTLIYFNRFNILNALVNVYGTDLDWSDEHGENMPFWVMNDHVVSDIHDKDHIDSMWERMKFLKILKLKGFNFKRRNKYGETFRGKLGRTFKNLLNNEQNNKPNDYYQVKITIIKSIGCSEVDLL